MLLRETISKTKILFRKTLQNFKSFFFHRYQKLPKLPSFNHLTRGSRNRKDHQKDQFYMSFFDELEANLDKVKESYSSSIMASKEPRKGTEDARSGNFVKLANQSPAKSKQQEKEKKTNKERSQIGKREESCSKNTNGEEGHGLTAQKMKDLEMMEAGDVEQVLDVEEALHYYSRLTSPVYLDLVDKFFMDIYSQQFEEERLGSTIRF
ncbi:hypothetical protein I3843_02G128000 [Carya illinoinensis]|uniref:OVATE domain-containing protein n=1 Tax=Carya illinoinensis TaxID=32201 RepID=A0A8T1RF63_CARIL|nr:uncharacterized protein LOC122301050 [Carya illinoinensis]KAG2722939.1 hypothetical protein I3760_02G150200 [Carya illinoinensis]KAG6665275.1 hypothetical protein CIPAW_02G150100 [Carya illinoinensis]KAG6727901.1 hypothetical protein I3842_02G147100 [Carya illinoinensis]KAG7992439.1 hypothetical protein I3843_02G128000 [Carya illinoinensis]